MLFTISGPRGAGKSTVVDLLRDVSGVQQIPPWTTRDIRDGERHGRDYNFVSREEFERAHRIGRGMFDVLECGGNYYGTPYATFQDATTAECSDVSDLSLVNLDVGTALNLRKEFGNQAVKTMYVLPRSWGDIAIQMRDAGVSEDDIRARCSSEPTDLTRLPEVDAIIVNGRGRIAGSFRAAADFIIAESGIDLCIAGYEDSAH